MLGNIDGQVAVTNDGTKAGKSGYNCSYQLADSSSNSAVVTLLGNITNGEGFRIGKDMAGYYAGNTKVTLDLNNYTYTFATPVEGAGISKKKGIQISEKDSSCTTSVTIKNGVLNIAEQTTDGARFERLIRSYTNLTIDNVTLDGTNVKGQESGENGAVLCHSLGTLTLTGNTSILTQDDTEDATYYALSGRFWNYTGDTNSTKFTINVEVSGKDRNGNDTTIKNIGLYEYTGTNEQNKLNKLNLKSGNVGEVTFLKSAVDSKGATIADNIEITSTTDGTLNIGSFDFVSGKGTNNLKLFKTSSGYKLAQVDSWLSASPNDSNAEYDYIVAGTGDKGNSVLNVKGVTDKNTLVFDDTTNRNIFGIPDGATATWGQDSNEKSYGDSYKYAYLNYNNDKDEVTVKGASAQNAIIAEKASSLATGILTETVKKIDARDNSVALSIIANSLNNTIYSGAGQSLTGGDGADVFIYGGGDNLIADYTTAQKDLVNLSSDFASNSQVATVTAKDNDLILNFGTGDSLTFTDGGKIDAKVPSSGITVESGNKTFVYNKNTIAEGYGLTLNAGYGGFTDPSKTSGGVVGYDVTQNITYYTIDGSAATTDSGLVLTGNSADNYFIGGNVKNTLYGGNGNDFLKGGTGADIFRYSEGKDTIAGFATGDKASISSEKLNAITSANFKKQQTNLIFTIDGKNNLTFADDNAAPDKIALNGGGFLTKDGYVDKDSAAKFKLFSGTKGTIDIKGDSIYGGGTGIASIDATASKNSVTLVGASVDSALNLASNKKKDLFEYGGKKVTISGYEGGKDKLDISGIGAISAFAINDNDVAISVGSDTANNVISLTSAKDQEVLIHDGEKKGNSYSKFVFHDTGVLYNKAKKPTEATLSTGAASLKADDSIKKIFAVDVGKSISIESGAIKSTLDASEAGVGVSLIGGAKNNKFIGSSGADMFVYKGGKDVIEDFQSGASNADSINSSFGMEDAKITLSKKSVKLKFDNKNTLTLKNSSSIGSAFKIGSDTYTFDKNAYSTDGGTHVSLTSQFSGTYKIGKDDIAQFVDGSDVKKNLTFKGTEKAETFIGGKKKTTFKAGGGGVDSLVGGSGKDIFFYAKGDAGTSNIADFEFGVGKDKLKIANGTISKITSVTGGGVQFAMTSGKKNDDSEIGWFKIESQASYDNKGENTLTTDDAKKVSDKVAIKANNTFYWFATEDDASKYVSASNGNAITAGNLITFEKKVKASDSKLNGYAIIDLGYSTNLAKTEVAIKVTEKPTQSQSQN